VSHGLIAQEGDDFSIDLVYINASRCGMPLTNCERILPIISASTLCISSNSRDSCAHFIEIGFIAPEFSQAHVGVGDSTTDRLTDFMSQGCC
jgi:hypothetical protein